MDVVCLHLDRPNCPGRRDDLVTPGWEQLADEFQVPEKIKSKCQNFREGNLSPSEAMFDHLASTSHVDLTIGNIKEHLRKIRRNDIVGDINGIVDSNSNLSGKFSAKRTELKKTLMRVNKLKGETHSLVVVYRAVV